MNCIRFIHDPDLKMPKGKEIMEVPETIFSSEYIDSDGLFITFRRFPKQHSCSIIENINACKRLYGKYNGNIVFYAMGLDTHLSPVIVWDIAHSIDVGKTITFLDDNNSDVVLKKRYYSNCFKIISEDNRCVKFEKIAPLPIEKDKGLDEWTFGIPTGPGDATILNAAVKRILEFQCTKKEIILCGCPGKNFKYWDKVKIVGEDIPAPPVQISRKKNCIAENASYSNICILHDRVFLPSDFMEAVKKYGDCYAVTTFQSLFFEDYYNLMPHRYSDYGMFRNNIFSNNVQGIKINKESNKLFSNSFAHSVIPFADANNKFFYQNPLQYSKQSYATGSLYIIKKSLMLNCPLDNKLVWEEFEDVEWGIRCNNCGIPHLINPYTFSQSITSRNMIISYDGIPYCGADGKTTHISNLSKRWYPIEKKPLFSISGSEMWERFYKFRNKYCPEVILYPQTLNTEVYIKTVAELLSMAQFELDEDNINAFLKDIDNLLYLLTTHSFKRYIKTHLIIYGNKAIPDIIWSGNLQKTVIFRLKGKLFSNNLCEYGVKHTALLNYGSKISAKKLGKLNKRIFYHPNGKKGFFSAIKNSTPYIEYFEGE